MTVQYGRKVTIAVGNPGAQGLDFSQFRCEFAVRRGDYQNPNTADVRIYNLKNETVQALTANPNTEYTYLAIQAGYAGNFGLIFKGVIKQARSGRGDQKDSWVDITAADGDEAYNFATIAISLAAGSTPSQVLETIIGAMAPFGIKGASYKPPLPSNGSIRGRVLYGMVKDVMREFASENACSWSIQNGELTLIPLTGYLPGPVPVISPFTGLIGTPEQTQQGLQITTLLYPNYKVGQLIKLDSKAVNQFRYGTDTLSDKANSTLAPLIKLNQDGLYYVMVANHRGDTRGRDFFTEMTCLAVDATNLMLNNTISPATAPPSVDGVVRRY